MGLDIRAFEKVELVQAVTLKELHAMTSRLDEERTDVKYLYPGGGFEARADGLVAGFYAFSGETIGFRAGSYGGYNRWREWLATLVGKVPEEVWRNPEPGTFVELIHFSDCEGIIGPKTSAKLASDFEVHATRADVRGGYNGEIYAQFFDAFRIASRGGAVGFH